MRRFFALVVLLTCAVSHADISVDINYGTAGTATLPLHSGTQDEDVGDIAIDANGKAVLVGTVFVMRGTVSRVEVGIARLNPDGTPDLSFSGDGIQQLALCAASAGFTWSGTEGRAVTILADGKILVAGQCIGDGPPTARAYVLRLLADGTVDSSFGTAGIAYLPGPPGSGGTAANALAVQSNGRIVVAGIVGVINSLSTATVMRLLADGTIDTSFGTNGYSLAGTDSSFGAIALMADDRIVAAGSIAAVSGYPSDSNFFVARLLPNGAPDTSFTGSGLANFDVGTLTVLPNLPARSLEFASDVALRPDGTILVAGNVSGTGSSERYALLAQLTPSGSLDANFGEGGYRALTAGGEDNVATQVFLRPLGDALVLGVMRPTQVSLTGAAANSYPPSFRMTPAAMEASGNLVAAVQPVFASADAFAATRLIVTAMPVSDSVPDAFSFAPEMNTAPGTLQTSGPATISGLTTAANVSVAGGEFSVGCANTWVAAGQVQTVVSGNTVCVRHTSAATGQTTLTTTLTIGGVSGSFASTTGDVTPEAFFFTVRTDAPVSTVVTSDQVGIKNITLPVPITVSGGQYSIGCGATFTSAAGTVSNDQIVCVRHTTSALNNSTTTTTLTVGGVAGVFTSMTAAPSPPQTLPIPVGGSGGGGSVDLLLLVLLAGILLARRCRRD